MLAAVATACLGLAACAASHPSAANASAHSATSASTAPFTVALNTPPGTPTCVGLSTCTPPPDAEGNPPCYYADGWQADASEGGIAVWYFHEPANLSKPDQVTAVVRMKDGTVASQIAQIDAAQQVHRFGFPGIDKSAVQEVLLSSGGGQCFVTGP
jgi:hypothetical protein